MQDKDLYILALLRYKEENPYVDVEKTFSIEWNLCTDYKLKTIIVAKAIQQHMLIEDTELYEEHFVHPNRKLSINKKDE